MCKIKLEQINGEVKVTSPYNQNFVNKARNFRGKWKDNAWWFDDSIIDYVREALKGIFGTTGEEPYEECSLLVKDFSDSTLNGAVTLFGRTIAKAYGRDSGAKLGDDIIFISGSYDSGGSVKNWRTEVDNATFEIAHFPLPQTETEEVKKAISEGWVEIKRSVKKRKAEEIQADIDACEKRLQELKNELNNERP